MSDAPERIWRVEAYIPSHNQHGLASWPREDLAGPNPTEYVSKDIHDAAVSKARVDALKEAASVCWKQSKRRADQASTAEIGIQRARWIAGKIQAETDAQIIESLIEKEPKP